jgi:hypothetical protein
MTMAADITLAELDRWLQACQWHPELFEDLPGIDPFHGIKGYSAIPRARRIVAALLKVERTPLEGQARLMAAVDDAGVAVWEVEQFLTEFAEMQNSSEKVAALGWWQKIKLVFGWERLPGSNEEES